MNEQDQMAATDTPHIDLQRVLAFRHDADIWGDYINLNVLGLQGAPDMRQIAYRGVLSFVPLNRDASYPSNPDTGIKLTTEAATELALGGGDEYAVTHSPAFGTNDGLVMCEDTNEYDTDAPNFNVAECEL